MINKLDQRPQINLEILHHENILPILPLMNLWATAAFQKPPYSFAGAHANDLVDPQDLLYVNNSEGVVVVAKSRGQVVGIVAGLPLDSRDLHSYLESRHEGAFKKIVKAGFNPSQMFYLTYILTSPDFTERSLLSCRIFDAIQNWAVCIGKTQICWQEDVSYSSINEKIETWKDDVKGFRKMGLQFQFCWPTHQLDGTIKEAEHIMEFFYKELHGPHPMNIKAIIFDCDGTLVDSEYAHYLAWQHALQLEGGDLTIEEYSIYVGKSIETNAKLLAEKIGSTHVDRIMENKGKFYHTLQNEGLPAIQHVVDFVHRLAQDKQKYGFKLGVASAAKKNEILINLRNLAIDKFFDIVISGYDDLSQYSDPEGVNKPKPYIYLHVAKELGFLPYECVVIEDSLSGVTSGINAGCITIAVPNDYTRQQDLSTANVKLTSFARITSYEDFLLILASNSNNIENKIL